MANQAPPAFTLHNAGTGLCLGLIVPVIQNGTQIQKAQHIHDAQPSGVQTMPVIGSSPRVPVLQNNTLTQSGPPPDLETLRHLFANPITPPHPCALDHTVQQQIPQQPTAPVGIPIPQPSSVNTVTPASSIQGEVPSQDPPQPIQLNQQNTAIDKSLYDGDSRHVSKDNLKSQSHIRKQQPLAARTSHSATTGGYTSPECNLKTIIHHHPASHGSDNHDPQSLQSIRRQTIPPCPDQSITVSQSMNPSRSLGHFQCGTSPGLISTQGDMCQTQELKTWLQTQERHFLLHAQSYSQSSSALPEHHPEPDQNSNRTHSGREEVKDSSSEKL